MALKGNQKKLDKNNNNRIDAQDFKILKAEKAKGRGMGLQDEKVKPGKVMKAKRGTGIKLPKEGSRLTFSGYSKPFEGPQHKGRVSTIVGVKPGAKIKGQRKKFKSMDEMRKAKGFKPGETAKDFNKRRMMLAGAKEAAKATRIGKIVLPIAAAGVAAQQYLKSKMKKKDKKMGGGMMKRPMGYKSGTSVQPSTTLPKDFVGKRKALGGARPTLGMLKGPAKAGAILGAALTVPVGKMLKKIQDKRKAKNRDEAKVKKMGGGMMKKYSKGSQKKLMTPKERAEYVKKAKVSLGATAESLMDKSQPKKRDRLFSKHGKMGGGMMKKYRSGGPVPVEKIKKAFPEASPGKVARMQTMLGDKSAPMKKERLFEGDRGRRKELIKKLKGVAKTTPMGLGIKAVETAKKLKEKMSKKMGGGMMQRPMGYVSGGAPGPAQARRPKLGRLAKKARRRGLGRAAAAQTQTDFSKRKKATYDAYVKNLDTKFDQVQRTGRIDINTDDIYDASRREAQARMKKGGSVTAKCKLGRNKPTKMY